MISSGAKVFVNLAVDRVITVRLPQGVAVVREQTRPDVQVVTVGQQGPVGTVSEAVLAMATEAKETASAANEQSADTATTLDDVIVSMTNGFNFHAGEISA